MPHFSVLPGKPFVCILFRRFTIHFKVGSLTEHDGSKQRTCSVSFEWKLCSLATSLLFKVAVIKSLSRRFEQGDLWLFSGFRALNGITTEFLFWAAQKSKYFWKAIVRGRPVQSLNKHFGRLQRVKMVFGVLNFRLFLLGTHFYL